MRIYNIFPSALEDIADWKSRLDKIKHMNFDYI